MSEPKKRCFFVRHGEIASNRNGRYAGWAEEELTEEGCRQAFRAAEKLRKYSPEVIYAGPLKRTVQTAEIMGRVLDPAPIIILEELKELRLGSWEGMCEQDIARQYPQEWHTWNTQPLALRLPGRESLGELLIRTRRAARIIASNTDCARTIVAVTHVALMRLLLLDSNRLDFDLYRTVDVPNAAILDYTCGKLL